MCGLQAVPCTDHIELGPMVDEIFADLAPLAEKNNITLERDGDGVMTGSDTLIYRLLFNLTENAIKYNRPGGSVRLSVTPEPEKLLIRVSDTGRGIPERFQRSIFSALLPGGQVPQPGIRRRGLGAFAGVGDRQTPRRYRVRGEQLGGRHHRGGVPSPPVNRFKEPASRLGTQALFYIDSTFFAVPE